MSEVKDVRKYTYLGDNSALSSKIEETHTYDPAIPRLEVYLRENCNMRTRRHIRSTFAIAKKWKQPISMQRNGPIVV